MSTCCNHILHIS